MTSGPVRLELSDDITLVSVLALQRAAYAVEAQLIGSDAIPARRETLGDLRRAPDQWIGISSESGLVAALAFLETPEVLDIWKLVVAPSAFRQGLGERLVREILDLVPRPKTIVTTGSANAPAVALYRKLGFTAVGEEEVVPGLTVTHFELLQTIAPVDLGPFRPEDQDAVRRLVLDGLEDHWGELDEGLNPDLDDLARNYGNGMVLVARRAGRLVGAAAVVPNGANEAEVKRLSVARDQRRTGVASALLRELVALGRRRGWRALVLETTATWTDAVGLYEAFGFTLTHYEDGQFGRDAYFRLDLPGD